MAGGGGPEAGREAAGGGGHATATAGAGGVAATVAPTAAELFEGLRDFRHLTRERSLTSLRKALAAGLLQADEVEPFISSALNSDTWEAKQGGLLAAAEALRVWDRSDFRAQLLKDVPRLLVDVEYRVRKAVAAVLLECCRRDGLAVYDGLAGEVLGDIRDKFKRSEEKPEDSKEAPPPPDEPPKFLPDTEGWRSLETSMGALEAMMQGCGAAFTPRITAEMLDLLNACSKHTNRFVREYTQFAFKNVFEVCELTAFLETVGPQSLDTVRAGILDNWSQVRYAGSVAARAFMAKAGDQQERFYPRLLGPMCLNRHYVAEGVRLYSQETWRMVCGPQGGARLLVAHFDSVIDAYATAADAPNHAVREAACHCISELASKVAGRPDARTPHREHFTPERIKRLLETLVAAFQDESWPVRDVASTALGHFVQAFPEDCLPFRPQLVDCWFDQMADNIPSLRQNGAAALAMAVNTWPSELWDEVMGKLGRTLPEVLMQPENSEVFSDYTPSGPFSVPKPKPKSLEDVPDPEFTDQTMYSCGSVAPKTFKRRNARRDAGCMNCDTSQPHQLWEASEGMVHLFAELAGLAAAEADGKHADALADALPKFMQCFGCSQFRHHHLLKQRICERLPAITEGLGAKRLRPHLPELLRLTAECAAQDTHRALQECALDALRAWRRSLPQTELEAACQGASLDSKVVLVA